MTVQTVAAHPLKLHDLKNRFNLQRSEAEVFFEEWLADGVLLTETECAALDRVKRNYQYLLEYPVMESIVKMIVLSPIYFQC